MFICLTLRIFTLSFNHDLNYMAKNVFITGIPGVGKTTLLKKLVHDLNMLVINGFHKEKIVEEDLKKSINEIKTDTKSLEKVVTTDIKDSVDTIERKITSMEKKVENIEHKVVHFIENIGHDIWGILREDLKIIAIVVVSIIVAYIAVKFAHFALWLHRYRQENTESLDMKKQLANEEKIIQLLTEIKNGKHENILKKGTLPKGF